MWGDFPEWTGHTEVSTQQAGREQGPYKCAYVHALASVVCGALVNEHIPPVSLSQSAPV